MIIVVVLFNFRKVTHIHDVLRNQKVNAIVIADRLHKRCILQPMHLQPAYMVIIQQWQYLFPFMCIVYPYIRRIICTEVQMGFERISPTVLQFIIQ